jgi:hypothetical protein
MLILEKLLVVFNRPRKGGGSSGSAESINCEWSTADKIVDRRSANIPSSNSLVGLATNNNAWTYVISDNQLHPTREEREHTVLGPTTSFGNCSLALPHRKEETYQPIEYPELESWLNMSCTEGQSLLIILRDWWHTWIQFWLLAMLALIGRWTYLRIDYEFLSCCICFWTFCICIFVDCSGACSTQ